MPLIIPDDVLKELKMDEREARIEIACRLFDAEKLALWPAAQFAGLSRVEMEDELSMRKIPIYRITREYWEQEKRTLDHLQSLDQHTEKAR